MSSRAGLFRCIALAVGSAVVFALPAWNRMMQAECDFPPGYGPADRVYLPEPFATPFTNKGRKVIGWPAGRTAKAPSGFRVNAFAKGLNNPRSLYVLPNGDVLTAESVRASDDPRRGFSRITLMRDTDKDGVAEFQDTFLTEVNMPYGMVLVGDRFLVGNTGSLVSFPYKAGQTKITVPGTKMMDLAPGPGHYTRNLIANADHTKIYIAVGSSSNGNENKAADREPFRAAIWEINPNGTGMRVFAGGLRNPVGMDWEPRTGALWTVVNERNTLGDDLVPDYLTRVREGAFYGWPYAYFGRHEDPTLKGQRPDLVAKSVVPDYALGGHTASLGLVFYSGNSFPRQYHGGAFISQHGSGSRSSFSGYKVVYLPFRNGKPAGDMEDFLSGFIADEQTGEVHGRPVGMAVLADGSLLVADDAGNTVWRVSYAGEK